jgi:hypothetical protein
MKTNLTKLATLLLLCLLTFGAQAVTLFTDNFDSYPISSIPVGITNDTTVWIAHSGTNGIYVVADPTSASANALQVSQPLAQDVHANIDTNHLASDITVTNLVPPLFTNIVTGVSTNITGTSTNYFYAYSPSNSVSALYASFTIYVTVVPTGAPQYFGMFYSTSGGFDDRLFVATNGAASGKFRIAENATANVTNTVPMDLSANTAYTVVTRYILSSGTSEVWVNPINEVSTANGIPDTGGSGNIQAYAFRQASANSGGTSDIDNLRVGTKFADVVPGSLNPPTVVIQPNDTNVFTGSSAIFSTLALGDDTLGYQWFSVTNGVTNSIAGATGKSLTLTSLTTNQTGFIFCVVTNGVGTNFTRSTALNVAAQPIPPIIDTNITPTAATNITGDTVAFTVVAHGLPAPAYQWKFVPATNALVTNIVAGATSATLTLTGVGTNQAGSYFVTITNSIGYLTTNSAKATLTVNPPPFVTIAQLRAMVDPVSYANTNGTSLFTIQGIVTTWTNMTSGSSPEFYLQDNTAGIAVFWSGAGASNTPPAGSIVRITAPFEFPIFSGLLTLEPVFTNTLESVTILGTTNLPTPQPLPFDPNIQNNIPVMQSLVGSYFVASNVFLNLSSPTFVSGANDPTTNIAFHVLSDTNAAYNYAFTNDVGETFIVFVNSHTDIPGQVKPTGPVTIYGVLGQFVSGAGPYTGGYEFTPSRFADIISYTHQTNVLSNIVRAGDLPTNSYTENFLEPGETMTSYLSIGDAAGGNVTLSPVTAGLPASASWSNVTNGLTGTAIFHFTPVAGDSGVNYPISVGVTSTAGSVFTNTFTVYVPSLTEQQVAITEFLANPTTNSAALNFNPLHRSSDTTGISTNDQYVELVNLSGSDIDTSSGANGWEVDQGGAQVMVFDALGSPPLISSSNAIVIYGGGTPTPTLPANSYASTAGKLSLPTSGTGTLVLRNGNGNIVDRVVYSASNLSTNGSLSRFPTINSPFVPQPYVSTNVTTAGLQYDGSPWSQHYKIPAGITGVGIQVTGGQAIFNFPANTTQANTLWGASNVTGPYSVLFGGLFPGGSGTFTNSAAGAQQFFYISTQ